MLVLALALAGCTTYPYDVRDGGDGVYYADSPPVYRYVDFYFGFPYYGPYSWSWYYPVWHAPIAGSHYSWYRPRDYWCHPFTGHGARVAQTRVQPSADWLMERQASKSPPDLWPTLSPRDLRMATVEPQVWHKNRYPVQYRSASMKQRMAAKGYAPTKSTSRAANQTPRASSMAPRSAPAPRMSSPAPRARQPARRSISAHEQ